MPNTRKPHRARWTVLAAAAISLTLTVSSVSAASAGYPSDSVKPDLTGSLSGFASRWKPSGKHDLHGSVKDAGSLQWNDRVTSWTNQNATAAQQFRALQNAKYLSSDGSGYDQSISIADGLGKQLGALYVRGRINGKLPLTSKLLNNTNGSAGRYVTTSALKSTFSYPRPYLNADPKASGAPGDSSSCRPSKVNASSLAAIRQGRPWADAKGNLVITRVPAALDTSRQYADTDVALNVGYGSSGLCTGGSFPSGHATSAYLSGIALATLLPELAPSILARTSEAAMNRIVLGVHYPLDVIGGRMNAQAAITARWVDKKFRNAVIRPAQAELVRYLESKCGARLAVCIAADTPYRNDPYAGASMPGGTSQLVTDRTSALAVYTERLNYGFPKRGSARAASVPSKVEYLLMSAFPHLKLAQRRAIVAQTEVRSGNPLDTSRDHDLGKAPGSGQRVNLAAAMSATVKVNAQGVVTVLSVGGKPTVILG